MAANDELQMLHEKACLGWVAHYSELLIAIYLQGQV